MFIEFSEFNYKLLFFLIYPIFRRIEGFTDKFIEEDNKLFKTFRHFLSFLFSGIFLLIFYFKTEWAPKLIEPKNKNLNKEEKEQSEEESYSNNLDQIDIVQKYRERKRKRKSALYLFSLCFLGFFSYYGRDYFSQYLEKEDVYLNHSIRTFLELTIYSALSYLLIKQKLYMHHLISFGSITIMLIIIFIITLSYINDILFPMIFFFLSEFVFALFDVLIKRYMNIFYKNPYFIMFFIGVIVTFLLLFYDAIAYFVNPEISGIIIGFQENINSVVDFLGFILDLFVEYLWNLGIWLLIFYFTPCHFFVSEYASQFIYSLFFLLNYTSQNKRISVFHY